MFKCKLCGAANSFDSSVCIKCGAKLTANRKYSTDSNKEIFSNTKSEELGRTGEQRDLFSSGEKYEKVRKGAVLEKIYEQELAMGEVPDRHVSEPETVKPIVINRQSSSDIVKSTKKYSSESEKARAAAARKIPQRIIEPVDSQLMGHKIKAKVTPEKNSDDNEKVELTPTNVVEDIQKRNRNKPKQQKNKNNQKKSVPSSQQGSEESQSKNKAEQARRDTDKVSPGPRKKHTSEAPAKDSQTKTEAVAAEPGDNRKALKTEKTGNGKANRKTAERTQKVVKKSSEDKRAVDTSVSKPVIQKNKSDKNVSRNEHNQGNPKQRKASSEGLSVAVSDEAKSEKQVRQGNKPDKNISKDGRRQGNPGKKKASSEVSSTASKGEIRTEKPVKRNPQPLNAEEQTKVKKPVDKAANTRSPLSETMEKQLTQSTLESPDVVEEITIKKARTVKSEAGEDRIKKTVQKKNGKTESHVESDELPKRREIPSRSETASDTNNKKSKKVKPADTYHFSPEDIKENRNISALAYIGILFLIPLTQAKKSDFCKAHVRQGIAVFIYSLIICLITLVAVMGLRVLLIWVLSLSFMIYNCVAFGIAVLMLILLLVPVFSGTASALNGVYKSVPIVGKLVNKK